MRSRGEGTGVRRAYFSGGAACLCCRGPAVGASRQRWIGQPSSGHPTLDQRNASMFAVLKRLSRIPRLPGHISLLTIQEAAHAQLKLPGTFKARSRYVKRHDDLHWICYFDLAMSSGNLHRRGPGSRTLIPYICPVPKLACSLWVAGPPSAFWHKPLLGLEQTCGRGHFTQHSLQNRESDIPQDGMSQILGMRRTRVWLLLCCIPR